MNETILGTYVNGNTIVVMYKNGTKVRYVKDGEKPSPNFPESMDLKITNRCSAGCSFCAEMSTPDGANATLAGPLLDSIKPYTELAIGGGNPLEHPDIVPFLRKMKAQKVICNLTVNVRHFLEYNKLIDFLDSEELIHGLGVSMPTNAPDNALSMLAKYPNAVVHTILGVTPWNVYEKLSGRNLNVLILGYKTKGNGLAHCLSHMLDINNNRVLLKRHLLQMRERFKAVAFDNLAVEQLSLRKLLTPEEVEQLYMGGDGEFTMYIDLVKGVYGKSSTHPLKPIDANSVTELFAKIHDHHGEYFGHSASFMMIDENP